MRCDGAHNGAPDQRKLDGEETQYEGGDAKVFHGDIDYTISCRKVPARLSTPVSQTVDFTG